MEENIQRKFQKLLKIAKYTQLLLPISIIVPIMLIAISCFKILEDSSINVAYTVWAVAFVVGAASKIAILYENNGAQIKAVIKKFFSVTTIIVLVVSMLFVVACAVLSADHSPKYIGKSFEYRYIDTRREKIIFKVRFYEDTIGIGMFVYEFNEYAGVTLYDEDASQYKEYSCEYGEDLVAVNGSRYELKLNKDGELTIRWLWGTSSNDLLYKLTELEGDSSKFKMTTDNKKDGWRILYDAFH